MKSDPGRYSLREAAMAATFRCDGTHEGPFFFERAGVQRCDACRLLVTIDQVRVAAARAQGGRDGNELQLELVTRERTAS